MSAPRPTLGARKLLLWAAGALLALTSCSRQDSAVTADPLLHPTASTAAQQWAFPLKIASSGRHLVDQNGRSFLINGDAGWSAIVGLTPKEAEQYLTTRKQQGFNAIIISLIEHHYAGGKNRHGPPFNRAGIAPFTEPGDFSKPDERYFAHADFVLKKAAELNLAVFLVPCYLGFPDKTEGWYDELKKNGVEKLRAYGDYVGRRYGAYRNIVWVAGGDRNPDEVRPQVLAMVDGIRRHAPNALWIGHTLHENSGADIYGDTEWLSLNSTYSYVAVPEKCLADYAKKPVRPNVMFETHYENDWDYKTADDLRRLAWSAALSGVCGQFFGNRPVWLFDTGWEKALNSPGTLYQMTLHRSLLSRRWENFVPESGSGLLPGGLADTEGSRKSAVIANDHSGAVVYLPKGGKVDVDLSRLRATSLQAWWLDPRTGTCHDAGVFANSHVEPFTAPGNDDWALFLDDVSASLPPPGRTDTAIKVSTP